MSSDAWWQRPVWPTTRPTTWHERGGRARTLAGRAARLASRPWALGLVAALGTTALVVGARSAAVSGMNAPLWWVSGSLIVAGALAGLAHAARALPRAPRVLAAASTAPVVALAVAALLVGVPYALGAQTSAGPVRTLGAVVPADVDGAVQVGEHVALAASSGGLTFLDLATGTARPVPLDAQVRWLNAVPGAVLVTTDAGATLLGEDGTQLWQHPGTGLAAPVAVAAAGDVVVLAQPAARAGTEPTPAVALHRDGSIAWQLDGATSPFTIPTAAGGVVEYGAALPSVALLDVDGVPTSIDVQTGRPLGGVDGSAPVAAIGDLTLWQQGPDGAAVPAGVLATATPAATCRLAALRGSAQVWSSSAPCVRYVEATRGTAAVYLAAAGDTTLQGGVEHVLDLATGATRESAGWSLVASSDVSVSFDAAEGAFEGRTVARDPDTGAVRWALPGGGRQADAPWASSTADSVVLTTRPLGVDPLATWHEPMQVSLVDQATGATRAWVRCSSGGVGNLALSGSRGLALCAQPDGTGRASILGG